MATVFKQNAIPVVSVINGVFGLRAPPDLDSLLWSHSQNAKTYCALID